MTTIDLLKSLTEGATVTAEMAEKANEILVSRQTNQKNRNSKVKAKKAEENAPLIASCIELLSDHKPWMASEIAKGLDIHPSKATAVAKSVPNIIIGEERFKGRVVKTYRLA